MGVVKKSKPKNEKDSGVKKEKAQKKDVSNGKMKDGKVKKKRTVSCLQCIKSHDDGGLEGKYRVAAPELMQDTFMSDSEDEGGEVECPIQQQQQYRYMNSEAGTLHRARPLEDSVTDGHLWPSNNDKKVATIDRQPLDIGFLVSFVVDARGGAMRAKRRGGVRIIVPPAACAAPTRVTCRAATRRAPAAAPPPLMEGEALASRLLELQPPNAKFLAPVIIEVPIYTASCREREIVILRSDTGETWQDHYLHNNDNPMIQEALQRERQEYGSTGETLGENGERVCRIVTCDFPHYIACVSRIRQEVHIIGPEGGTVSSAHTPQVQALFPPQALTKRIRVGLQAHGAPPELCRRILPRHGAVSPVITVEPRRRKFHRSITLTAPLPSHDGGKPDKQSTSNLRLLCSIMGGQARAVWEDVTGSTPLTVTEDCASFTTTVSARFWLMNCQNVSDATKLATELYREMLTVPFEARIVVLGKRLDALEGRLLVLYITDRYAYDTLLKQEHYTEVAHSTAVRFMDGKRVYLEFSGNLVPVTKSGTQPAIVFEAFKDNRTEFTVRVKHHEESPAGRVYFMNEPKVPKGEQSQTPACVLDVQLPDSIAPRAGKSHGEGLNLDQSGFDALKDELSFHWEHHSIDPPSIPHLDDSDLHINGHDKHITNGDVKYPTTDSDNKGTIPHVNGDTLHVDSNKAKATFDSDEDKTPMNTLEKGEKGKKKSDGGGFFGGIAGKVKNVFSHSEDREDDSKESSPKPQPKPRESKDKTKEKSPKDKSPPKEKTPPKEKSPPKPAPRIINEDLLDKVEDMFKDLKTKPHLEDDNIESEVYATKLVVDEDTPGLKVKTEEVYEQYANMQPVETPLKTKTSDPFAFYYDCCEQRFKGQKHTHDETSNVCDIIENAKFTAQEKIAEVEENVEGGVKESLNKLDKEKDNIKQKANEVVEEIIEKTDKIRNDAKHKEKEIKDSIQEKAHQHRDAANDKLDELFDATHKFKVDVNAKASDTKDSVLDEIQDAKLATKETAGSLKESAESAKDSLKNKANEVDLIAREKAEEIKNKTNEKLAQLGDSVDSTSEEISETIENAKGKVKSKKDKAKKKGKEGKNFLSGLVHNIFGEKEKIEAEIKEKVAEGKETTNDLVQQAAAKKDEVKDSAAKKQQEIEDKANQLAKNAQAKKDEIEKSAQAKLSEAEKAVHDKTEQTKKAVEDKKNEVVQAVNEKKEAVETAVQNKADEAKKAASDAQDKLAEVQHSIEEKAHETKQALHDKKDELEKAAHDKAEAAKKALEDKKNEMEEGAKHLADQAEAKKHEIIEGAESLKQSAKAKKDEAVKAMHDTTESALHAAQDKKDELERAAHEKAEAAKKALKDKKNEIEDGAKHLADQAEAKKNELKEGAESLKQSAIAKKDETVKAVHDTTESAIQAAQDKKEKLKQGAQEVGEAISNKQKEIGQAIHDKKDEVQNAAASELDWIRQEAEHTTDQIKKSAEDTINAASDKKSKIEANVSNKVDDLKKSGKEGLEHLENAASEKVGDLQRSSKQAFDHAQDSTLSAFDKVESAAKDKVSDAQDTWENLQSSTQDTLADFRDDVHGWENSAQDTMHSFQSSAGNTFDSLDESAKEFAADVQATANKADTKSKELFGEAKDSFEGFKVSADNKLEEVTDATAERLEQAGARLSEAGGEVHEGARGAGAAVAGEVDHFASNLNDLGNAVFGASGKGFMKDSSAKLLESEKKQSSPSPNKKSSGIPKLKRKK